MHQDVYIKIGGSLAPKRPLEHVATLKKSIQERYDFQGRLGFLEKGMSRDAIVDLLGAPTGQSDSTLTYARTRGRRQTTYTIPVTAGVFEGFEPGWLTSAEIPPKPGSADWLWETVDRADPGHLPEGERRPPLSKEEIRDVFDRFAEIGPTARGDDWNTLCRTMFKLFGAGHQDPRVLPIVRKRFPERDIEQHYAAHVLHKYDPEGCADLIAERLRYLLELPPPHDDSFDIGNLVYFVGDHHPDAAELTRKAMEHPNRSCRWRAFSHWDRLTEDQARTILLRGLEDPYHLVRQDASEAFARRFGDKRDLPALRARLAKEPDKRTRDNLARAIDRIEK